MSILYFTPPKKKQSVEEWKKHSFDGGPDGGYVPNVVEEDLRKYRAKAFYKTDDPRIEIRSVKGSQIVVVVRLHKTTNVYGIRTYLKDEQVRISTNGPIQLSFDDLKDLADGIEEARQLLISNAK